MSTELSYEERVAVTRSVFLILKDWEVPPAVMPALLGFNPQTKRRELNRYRLGSPLPDEAEIYQRALLLIDIENSLHKMFPHSQISANLWVTTPRVKFGNETPLDLMLRRGLEGIRTVAAVLSEPGFW
jgi:hypothetical protein